MMEQALRYLLPIYLVVYVLAAFFWRSYRVWRATGVNPVVLGSGDSAHDYIGKVFKVLFALIAATVVMYAASDRAYEYLMPIPWLQAVGLKIAGMTMLALSLAWTVVAQAQMGESWRIGIDSQRETTLVRRGVFGVSRNPIFLGMIMTLAGLFLVLPTAVTLLILILGFVLIQVQVRLEEEHLTRMHGEGYLEYRREVRRWL
jgi:protein-S-isoprenylcysteine O-methyltransferase Ste14